MSAAEAMITIKLASAGDHQAIFRARHEVYAKTDRFFRPRADGVIVDRFDALHSSQHLVAEADGRLVGGIRLTQWSEAGLPALDYFDFWPHLSPDVGRLGSGSMLFVAGPMRRAGVAERLLEHWYARALALQWDCALGVLNPPIVPWFVGHGWRSIAGPQRDPHTGVPFVPVVLRFDALAPDMVDAARRLLSAPAPGGNGREGAVDESEWPHAEQIANRTKQDEGGVA